MKHQTLGQTGLEVSVLSMGGAAFGDMYGKITLNEAIRTIHMGIDAGINLIDTSPYYGLGKSESVLGEALNNGYRQRTFLCTKAGRNGDRDFDFTPSAIQASVEASLSRLRTDYVDILIAHDIEFAQDFELVFNETSDTLHKLKRQGKCRFIGMSCYPLGLLARAIERCSLDVVISYCHFNLQNNLLLTELLPVAEQFGVGVLNGSPLGMGLLTNQGPPPWHPASAELKGIAKNASEYCASLGEDISLLGMQFCLSESLIGSTITGTARIEELTRNLKILETPINQELLAEVLNILGPIKNLTWPSGNWRN
jgi:L-galactose dehydrogenase